MADGREKMQDPWRGGQLIATRASQPHQALTIIGSGNPLARCGWGTVHSGLDRTFASSLLMQPVNVSYHLKILSPHKCCNFRLHYSNQRRLLSYLHMYLANVQLALVCAWPWTHNRETKTCPPIIPLGQADSSGAMVTKMRLGEGSAAGP
jgi:hypothetical protein